MNTDPNPTESATYSDELIYTGKGTDFYIASEQVADTVNLAIELHRPILVEGEPGCGKTMLAYSIAAEKGLDKPVKIVVKSTSRAQDMLYRIDTLCRLQDAQNPRNEKAQFIYPYLSLGPLGLAISQRKRSVVLIDEIDKADIDFPNDLLDVLDTFSFQIDDLPVEEEATCLQEKGFGRTIVVDPAARPIVVITSNREKRLPEPFLRRCLYIRLRFPETSAELCEIVRRNTQRELTDLEQEILEVAVDAFRRVRDTSIAGGARKPPATSELIDWVQILYRKGTTVENLNAVPFLPPYWQLLFKNMNDLDTYPTLAGTRQR